MKLSVSSVGFLLGACLELGADKKIEKTGKGRGNEVNPWSETTS
jgi:hypothetical protein